MPDEFKVAYYLSRFPKLTETFILREMLILREIGVDVHVFSLLPPLSSSKMHQQVQEMMPYAHYCPYLFSLKLVIAQAYFLFRSPIKYFRAFWRAVWQALPEPPTVVKILIIFPKAVFYARQLEKMKVNHIHAHFVWISGISAQIASDLIGITYSLHAHAWDIFQRDPECVRRQLVLATAIVTVSEYHRKYLANLSPFLNPEYIRIVHYGLDLVEFSPYHVSIIDNTIHIISIGRLEEKKGHEYLIDACKQLLAKGYKFHCSIVGSGYLMENLQSRINDHGLNNYVKLLGAMNQTEVRDLYHRSDIFVLACVVAKRGDRDGMPNVLLEAMAMELPVITTPVTGNPELVHNEKNGLLVPERDSQALSTAIERLINDQDLRINLGKQGRQTVIDGFDIHKTGTQLAEIFQGICYLKHKITTQE